MSSSDSSSDSSAQVPCKEPLEHRSYVVSLHQRKNFFKMIANRLGIPFIQNVGCKRNLIVLNGSFPYLFLRSIRLRHSCCQVVSCMIGKMKAFFCHTKLNSYCKTILKSTRGSSVLVKINVSMNRETQFRHNWSKSISPLATSRTCS